MKVKEESEKVGLKVNIQKTKIMASGPITSWQIDGERVETVTDFILGGSKITADGDCSYEIKRWLLLGGKKKSYDQPRQHIKKQRHYFANKCPSSQSYGFSSGHVWMWELDSKESWAPKNGCFWAVVLEKTLESPLHSKEIQPVHPKGNRSWIFIGRTDGEAETPILWPPDVKNWLIWKAPSAGKDWGRVEKGTAEDEMVGWGWDVWMASPTQWTWVWVNSGSWWWKGRPGVLQSMQLQRAGHDWLSDWTELKGLSLDCPSLVSASPPFLD